MTRGQADEEWWVEKYSVYYSTDGASFKPVVDDSQAPAVFTGNSDQHTPNSNFFSPVMARYVQIRPLEFHNSIGLRFNLLGCQAPNPSPVLVTPSAGSTSKLCAWRVVQTQKKYFCTDILNYCCHFTLSKIL